MRRRPQLSSPRPVPYAAPAMRARARVFLLPLPYIHIPSGRGVARACVRACVVGWPPIHAPALALLWGRFGALGMAWHGMARR